MKIAKYLEYAALTTLEEKPLSKCSAREFIEKAGTCKGTFYKNYADKYELVNAAFKHLIFDDVSKTANSFVEFVELILPVFRQHCHVVYNAFESTDVNSVRHLNEKILFERIVKDIKAKRLQQTFARNNAAKIYSEEITTIVTEWAHTGCKESETQLEETIRTICPWILYKALYRKTGKAAPNV